MTRHHLRWPPIAAALAILAAGPAYAAHTQDAVVYNPATGEVVMVVLPADDTTLDDPAFNPPGLTQVRVAHQNQADPVALAQAAKPQANIQLPSAALDAAIAASVLSDPTPAQPVDAQPVGPQP